MIGSGTPFVPEGGNSSSSTPVDRQTFTSSGTWTKPAGVTMVRVRIQNAGQGGGSGRRGAAGTVRGGGGGGASGGGAEWIFVASTLPGTVAVTIGAPGLGGAAVTTDDTDGNPGGLPGISSFGTLLVGQASTGTAPGGGTTSAGTAGAAGVAALTAAQGGAGAAASGAATGQTATNAPGGGGGGGGITSGDALSVANTGGAQRSTSATLTPIGSDGTDMPAGSGMPGFGGGGGPASLSGAATKGGDGGDYGAGGGGGGASVNGNNSGKGGDGGLPIIIVEAW